MLKNASFEEKALFKAYQLSGLEMPKNTAPDRNMTLLVFCYFFYFFMNLFYHGGGGDSPRQKPLNLPRPKF